MPDVAATIPSFNSEFYVAAITVIPIYFVMTMLPGGVLHEFWIAIERRYESESVANKHLVRRGVINLKYFGLELPILVLIAAALPVEVLSIILLSDQHANTVEHFIVFGYFVVLPFFAIVPIILSAILRVMSYEMWCQQCNFEVTSQAKFCPGCGTPASSLRALRCSSCKEPVGPDDKFCQSCQSSVESAL